MGSIEMLDYEMSFEEFINKNPNGIIIFNNDGIIVFVNQSAQIFFEQPESHFIGTPIFIKPQDDDLFEEIVVERKNKSKGFGQVLKFEGIWKGEKANILLIQDITRLKNIEECLERSNHKILETQSAIMEQDRLKVLLQLTSTTMHELSQPLMSLLGNVEYLRLKMDDPIGILKIIPRIEDAGQMIANIVKKIQTIKYEGSKPYSTEGTNFADIETPLSVLYLEKNDDDFKKIYDILKPYEKIFISRALNIQDAICHLENEHFDLVISCHVLSDGNSIDLLKILNEKKIRSPIIVITWQKDASLSSKIIQKGAFDYLQKERLNEKTLFLSINSALRKFHIQKESKEATEKLAEMSIKDEMTKLYNRRYMNEMLDKEFTRVKVTNLDMACMLVDIDYFKQINDQFGHSFADFVLKEFASTLKKTLRGSDYCFRYSGEEFMVLLPNNDLKGAKIVAEKIRKSFENKIFSDGNSKTNVTVSIGVVSFKAHKPSKPEEMLAYADKAVYKAKAEGRNRIKAYIEEEDIFLSAKKNEKYDLKYLKENLLAVLDKTRKSAMSSLDLLVKDMGDDTSKERYRKLCRYLDVIGQKFSLPSSIMDTIKRAASLHDCFRILISKSSFAKPGDELSLLKDQPYMLVELAELFDFFVNERTILLYHHENYDGTGYPEGLKEDQIPLGARIFSVASFVTKLMFENLDFSIQDIIEELTKNSGTLFDPNIVNLFISILKDEPKQIKD
ncbi:MAG: diguanylate cyclase [Desulfobacterales bacterium]|nr:diguanylate cyclase [Desulfobacterales bacterium]